MTAAGLPQRLAGRLERGRAMEEARQLDTCRITRAGQGEGEFNKETGQHDDPDPVLVYEGPCRIPKRGAGASSTADSGDAAWQVGEYPLNLPFSMPQSASVRTGMTVTYLTAADDPALAGNVYGITDESNQSQATARRFRMKRVTGS